MKKRFTPAEEKEFVKVYVEELSVNWDCVVRSQLLCISREFGQLTGYTDDGVLLNHSDTTEWIPHWISHVELNKTSIAIRLRALCRFWNALMEKRIIDANALALVSPKKMAQGSIRLFTIPPGLHRDLIDFIHSRKDDLNEKTRLTYAEYLRSFILHISLSGGIISEQTIGGWFETLSTRFKSENTIYFIAGMLDAFLRFMQNRGRAVRNPFVELDRFHSLQGRRKIVDALMTADPERELARNYRPKGFRCFLAPRFESFVAYKRVTGCRYQAGERHLADFDNFIAERWQCGCDSITREMVSAYACARNHLKPQTLKAHLIHVRDFCTYLLRYYPQTFIPDKYFYPARVQRYKPFIFREEDVEKLLSATSILHAPLWPLRADTIRTLIVLLYTSGLRPGEALRLKCGDVDLEQGTIVVRETKFYKTRLLPLSAETWDGLKQYDVLKERLIGRSENDHPFFISKRKGMYDISTVDKFFRTLVVEAKIRVTPGRCSPRIYDLRHSFAVGRLLLWYREDADVQKKLSYLSTYMGHVNLASTQVYLTATPELLHEVNTRFRNFAAPIIGTLQKLQEGNNNENQQ